MHSTCAVLSSTACLALQHFSTLSHKRHDFRGKKKLLSVKFVFWFFLQLWSYTFFSLRRIEQDVIVNVQYRSLRKLPVILVRF